MDLTPKQEAVMALIKDDPAYENYFFSRVSDPSFFFALKKAGYFSVKNMPVAQPADEEGYFIVPEWNVLPYLEKLSQQIKGSGDDKYIDELLAIIKAVSSKRKDNYRTWWYFVKILLNIPNDRVPFEIIELVPVWLDSQFSMGLQGSEISEKLLPKFLPEAPSAQDIEKAEKILESITEIKQLPVDKEKTILPERRATTLLDNHWLVNVFEKCAEDIGKKCSSKVISGLAEKQRFFLRNDKSQIDLEINAQQYLLVLEEKDANFLVQVLSVGQQTEDAVLETLLSNKRIDGHRILKYSLKKCDRYSFEDTVFEELLKSDIFKGGDGSLLRRKVWNLHRNLFSSGTYESFYEHERLRGAWFSNDTLTFGLKRILDAKAKQNEEETREILKQFLEDDYIYFPKLALYIIGRNIDRYADIFWDLLETEHDRFVFEATFFGDELKHLLQNLEAISEEQRRKIGGIINQGPTHYIPEEDSDKYILLWKQRRYHALSSDPFFRKLYSQLEKKTKVKAELRPAVGPTETRTGPGPSPLTKEQLLKMSNKELASFIATFEQTSFWKGPTIGGLSDMLKVVVEESPNKFTDNLSPFLNTGYLYVYDVLRGTTDAWKTNKTIEWGKLLDFIENYTNQKEFWSDAFVVKDDDWNAGHLWVIGAIGKLIEVGTQDDSWAFDEKHLPVAERILISIGDRLEVDKEKDTDDAVSYALNSATGKVVAALISVALRAARLHAKKSEKTKWSKKIQELYDRLLKDEAIEAYTILGQYMPNLTYLDKAWVEQKIHELEEIKDRDLWSAFMEGYLFSGRVYDDLYALMKNHYMKGIEFEFKEEHANNRLIQHITLQYMRDIEDLSENSLFTVLLDDWKPSIIRQIIGFFWSQRDVLIQDKTNDVDQIKKIITFWKQLAEHYKAKEKLTKDEKKVLSSASGLVTFVPEINKENFEWLKLSAPYVHIGFDSPFFIEYLDILKDRGDKIASARFVGQLFLEMLEAFMPDYDKDHIRSIVEHLFLTRDNEAVSLAEKICNIYAKSGSDFLRDIYDRNRT